MQGSIRPVWLPVSRSNHGHVEDELDVIALLRHQLSQLDSELGFGGFLVGRKIEHIEA